MNHKRKKVKSRRAGCLMCKPHKHQNAAKHGLNDKDHSRKQAAIQEIMEAIYGV